MTVLVTRESGVLKRTFSLNAQYVFLPNSLYDNGFWDKGDNTMQCTRRPDVIKLWLMWKAKGQSVLGRHVDYCYDMSNELTKQLANRSEAFELILPEFESHQVSFYYIPRLLRPYSLSFRQEILKNSKFTREMRKKLGLNGKALTCIASLPRFHEAPPFFVFNLANSALTPSDLTYLLDQIEFEGEDPSLVDLLRSHISTSSSSTLIQKLAPLFQLSKEKMDRKFQGQGRRFVRRLWEEPQVPINTSRQIDNDRAGFISAPIRSLHLNLMEKAIEVILDKMTYWEDERKSGGVPAQNFRIPEQLLEEFDFSLDPAKTMGTTDGVDEISKLVEIFHNINKYSVHFSHPYYNYNLSQGLDPYTLMADYIIAVINSPSTFHEDNPIFCKMEEELVATIRRLVGYSGEGDGLVVPGGSASIQIAMSLASTGKSPQSKVTGQLASGEQLVCFVSKAGHYATAKGSFYMGFGLENCISVDVDESGRMSVPALRSSIQTAVDQKKIPFFCVATAGTTVLGVFDNLHEIAAVCQEYNIWLHVDGSYGGATLMSSNHEDIKAKFRGVEKSDSFSFNAHKVFGSVRESSVLVTNRKNVLRALSPLSATDGIDIAKVYQGSWQDFDPECVQIFPDRRGNVFKMFFLLKAKGIKGLGEHVDAAYRLTEEVTTEILENRRESFVLCNPGLKPQSPHVNFYFLPQRLRSPQNFQQGKKSAEFIKEINAVTHEIIRRVTLDNRMTIAKKEYRADEPMQIVLALTHSAINLEDVKYMLNVIEYYGQNL